MRIIIFCCILLAFGCAKKQSAQKTSVPEFQTTATGMKYKFYKDSAGPNAKLDDFLTTHMILKTAKDSILRSTFTEGQPIQATVSKPTFKGSLEEAFMMLSPGDSAIFFISADSLFEKTFHAPMPPFIEKGSNFKFILKVLKVTNREQMLKEQREREAVQIRADSALIAAYVKANGLKGKFTESGLFYVQTQKGNGAQAKSGQAVEVHYTGKTLNGNVFDSSVQRGTPFQFTLGTGAVIRGWDEGIALMKVGEKGTLLIPSYLGYGQNGAGAGIPPNAVLIFDVELVSTK